MATYGEKRKVFLLVFSSILVPPPSCGLRKEKFAEIEERGRHLQTLGRTNYNFVTHDDHDVDDHDDDDYGDDEYYGRVKLLSRPIRTFLLVIIVVLCSGQFQFHPLSGELDFVKVFDDDDACRDNDDHLSKV